MWRTLVLLFAVSSGFSCHNSDEDVVTVKELSATDDAEAPGMRIMGGTPANFQMYPFVVQVVRNNQLVCGGALLNTRVVLSAAHCFVEGNGQLINRRQFTIRAGTAQLNSGGQTRSVSRIVNHEQYNIPPRNNDISIVILSSRFTLGNELKLAALASSEPADNATVTHVGWGATFLSLNPNAPAPLSNFLQEVTVNVVNRTQCINNYNFLSTQGVPGSPFFVTQNMMCSGLLGVGGRDACTGDNGGPVIRNGLIVGITSWGFNCGEANYPRVNTRIASYIQWINVTVTRNDSAASKASVVIMLASLISALHLL